MAGERATKKGKRGSRPNMPDGFRIWEKRLEETKSYPFELTAEEIVFLFKCLPVLGTEPVVSQSYPMPQNEKGVYLNAIADAGLLKKFKLELSENLTFKKDSDLLAYYRINFLINFLRKRPIFVTAEMREVIDNHASLKKAFGEKKMLLRPDRNEYKRSPEEAISARLKDGDKVLRSKLSVPERELFDVDKLDNSADENGRVQVVVHDTNILNPLVREESIKQDIMAGLLDRMQLVMSEMTPKKIRGATFYNLSKGMESLMKAYNMFRNESSNNAILQINIKNMTLEEKRELSNKINN